MARARRPPGVARAAPTCPARNITGRGPADLPRTAPVRATRDRRGRDHPRTGGRAGGHRTDRQVPEPASSAATAPADSASAHRKRHRRPRPGDHPPERPGGLPGAQRAAQLGLQRDRRGLQVVAQRRGHRGRLTAGQRGQHGVDRPDPWRVALLPEAIQLGEDGGGGQAALGHRQHQCRRARVITGESRSPRPVPSAVPPASANGTSAPSSRPISVSCRRSRSSSHRAAQPTSAAAAIGAATAIPPATGICLAMSMANRTTRAGPLGQQPDGHPGEVLGPGRHPVGRGAADRGPARRGDRQLVGQVQGVEDGDQIVVAVVADVTDGQVQVDLGRGPDPDHRAGRQARGVTRGSFVGGRIDGLAGRGDPRELLHREHLAPGRWVDAGPGQDLLGERRLPAQSARAAPQSLAPLGERRIDHTANTTRNRSLAARPGRASKATSAESTGAPARRRSADRPGPARVAVPGELGARRAVGLEPGRRPAGRPTSACTITSTCRRVGTSASRCRITGTAHVVRQVGHQGGGDRPGRRDRARSGSAGRR